MKNLKNILRKAIFILPVLLMSANVYARSCTRYVRTVYINEKIITRQTTARPVYSVRTAKTTEPAETTVTEKPTETTTQAVQSAKTVSASDVSGEILSLVNRERAANGLSALTLDAKLSAAAQAKAEDMYNKGYFSHTSPTYGSPFDMMKSFGISYRTAGENIAKGQKTPSAVMSAWMNSEGHRKNILGSAYTKLGVGYVNAGGTTYWVQLFVG